MNANKFTFAQWGAIIHVAKYMDMGVEYTAKTYGIPLLKKGGGIWAERPEDEVIPALSLGLGGKK